MPGGGQGRTASGAIRIVVSAYAGITAAAGVMHGCFEVVQRGAPAGLVVNAIGPDQRLWTYAGLHAFTVIPSLRWTGVAAIVLGVVTTAWAVFGVHRQWGPWVLLVLNLALFCCGGGFGPLGVGVVVSLVATRIDGPWRWSRRVLRGRPRDWLASAWAGILAVYVVLFAASVATTISGRPLTLLAGEAATQSIVLQAGYVLLAVMAVSLVAAFAADIRAADNCADAGATGVRARGAATGAA